MVVLMTVLKALLLLALAALGASLLRRGTAALRHRLWALTFVALLLLPLASLTPLGWEVQLPPAPGGPLATAAEAPLWQLWVGVPSPRGVAAALLWAWALGSLLLLLRLSLSLSLASQSVRRAAAVHDPTRLAELAAAERELGLPSRVQLREAAPATVPLAFGLRPPVVLLPVDADGWPRAKRRTVLLHELAHVKRRDWLWQLLAAVVPALYWPLVPVWWAARRLRLEGERACDEAVLQTGIPASSYAAVLLEFAREQADGRWPAHRRSAAALLQASQLSARITSLLTPTGKAEPRSPGPRSWLIGLLAASALVLIGLRPAAVEPTVEPVRSAGDPMTLIGPEQRAGFPLELPCRPVDVEATTFCRVLVLPRGGRQQGVAVMVRVPNDGAPTIGGDARSRTELEGELEGELERLAAELLWWLERTAPEPHLPDWVEAQEYGL